MRSHLDQQIADLQLRDQSPRPNETYDLTGRTRQWSEAVPGTFVLVTIGQSTSNNTLMTLAGYQSNPNARDLAAVYTPSNGNKVKNLSIGNKGVIFDCVDPLLGGESIQSHYMPRLGDKLIDAALCQEVVGATIAVGGSWAADWCPGGGTVGTADGPSPNPVAGVLAYRIGLTARCLANAGLLGNTNVQGFVLWQQGEWDSDGTTLTGTSQANYEAALNGVIAEFRFWGIDWPFLVALCTRPGSGNAAAIRAAQAAVVNTAAKVYSGPDIDLIGSTTADRYDGTHLIAASVGSGLGSDKQVDLWKSAIMGVL